VTIEVQSPPRAPRAEFLPLRDYALIGDAHGAALVSRDGVIDWCVSPEIGSPPFFLRLLDPDKGGYFGIQPDSDFTVLEHVYLPGTNIVRTVFQTAEGQLELLDDFDVGRHREPRDAQVGPYHELLRAVRCVEGTVRVRLKCRVNPCGPDQRRRPARARHGP
jgi:GH15 family glucan-1,4-alpha-glucosidase